MVIKKKTQAASKTETDKKEKKVKKLFAPSDTPIVISGGSISLEYADKDDDGSNDFFEPDGHIPNRKKKFKHKKNMDDKAHLTYLIIVDKDDESNVIMKIELEKLRIHKKCKIKIYYDIQP